MEQATNNVTEIPKQPSSAAVKNAEKALESKSKRAFPGAMDGTVPEGDKTEGEAPEVKHIASDNLPVVPKPDEKINKFIMDAKSKMDDINAERAVLNGKASLVREELKEKGIDVKTFEYQCRLIDMDEDKRMRVDQTSRLVRVAAGKPIQDELFGEEEVTQH